MSPSISSVRVTTSISSVFCLLPSLFSAPHYNTLPQVDLGISRWSTRPVSPQNVRIANTQWTISRIVLDTIFHVKPCYSVPLAQSMLDRCASGWSKLFLSTGECGVSSICCERFQIHDQENALCCVGTSVSSVTSGFGIQFLISVRRPYNDGCRLGRFGSQAGSGIRFCGKGHSERRRSLHTLVRGTRL
jgi:hypothetical protein